MDLSGALGTLKSTSDQTHKFWAYYQAFTAAAIGFAWASTTKKEFVIGLAVAYPLFAYFSNKLVASSQADARLVWDAIQQYTDNHPDKVAKEFQAIPAIGKPETAERVRGLHIAISLFSLGAILARLYFPFLP
jgi:hypothetical protein